MIGFFISYMVCGFLLCLFVLGGWFYNPHAMRKVLKDLSQETGIAPDWIVTIWISLYLFAWPYILIAYILKARGG